MNKDVYEPHVDTWAGCYRDNWVGVATDACMAHPAKFSKALIFKIVEHALTEGWLAPGATVLNPSPVSAWEASPACCTASTGLGASWRPGLSS